MSDDDAIKHWLAANTLKPGQWFDIDVIDVSDDDCTKKALAQYRNAIIEGCALVARRWAQANPEFRDCWQNDSVYAAIRARKWGEPVAGGHGWEPTPPPDPN